MERDAKQQHLQLEMKKREAARLREIQKQDTENKWPQPSQQSYQHITRVGT